MIKSITLQNFQSHKNTTIDFCGGVNAIVGLSDSGKTAILRAINWVATNKPTGDAFQSNWGGETIVRLTLGNEIVITRGRCSSSNYYMIDDVEFKAFGLGVPLEVQQVLNFGDINIEKQMDVPFLLGSSPGEVAQVLNRIVDLDNIDASISSIRKEKMKTDGELRTEKSRYASTCEELKQYAYLKTMEQDVDEAEELNHNIEQTVNKIKQIRKLFVKLYEQQKRINKTKRIVNTESYIISIQQEYDKLVMNYRKMKTLDLLLTQYDEAKKKIEFSTLIDSEVTVNQCIKLIKNIEVYQQKIKNIYSLLKDLEKWKKLIQQRTFLINTLEQKYDELMPDVCPLCGSM